MTDRAIADYDKAIAINPRHADAYVNRGNAYGEKGQTDGAIADLDKAITEARAEVAAARAEQMRQRSNARREFIAAKAALTAMPAASPQSVAKYFGIKEETYALYRAGQFAGMNLAGIVLMFVAGHGIARN
jgi:tetratricopeptide (TPR) repeat protein